MNLQKIAIVGGGIIGMSTAVAVKQEFSGCEITVFSETFSPDTCGDGSAGFWTVYLCGNNPQADLVRWSGETHRWLENFWKKGLTPETGVTLIPVIRATSTPGAYEKVPWLSLVYGFRRLNNYEISRLCKEHHADYRDAVEFLTYTSEPRRLLPWLMNKFRSLGGIIRTRKINKLNELAEEGYGIVINCSGLGARELVGDSMVKPVRGQVIRVNAPWSFQVVFSDDDDGNYIIPNIDSVVLGGTHQENDYDTNPRVLDSKFIRIGCGKMISALEDSEIITEWVGLRPGRVQIRLESEIFTKSNNEKFTVIHNYGHGGAGVTLSWGCALDVVKILEKLVGKGPKSRSHL